ncbi:aldo-keto reductase family 1 member B1-like isoform X2 [Argopecten irradians]|uniref:aldo-keto reductase family 1 member B1-like isoform X2 n=1 Tax=Argopecten irradians TaxID=31199 RepID=UPI00371BAA7E
MSAVPEQTFASGYKIPCVGLGTWKAKPEEVGAAVKSTVRLGYHHLDCALVYGNEKEIGKAIKECIDEGLVKREDLFITTKENAGLFPMTEDGLTDVIDIDYTETWTTMQDLVNQGLCRSIGVSNFNSKQIQRLIDLGLKHPISCNQVILRWGVQ